MRRNLPEGMRPMLRFLYSAWNTSLYLLKPFLGASMYYFDVLKDLVFLRLIYTSIMDLTQGEFSVGKHPFEFAVVLGLVGVFLTNVVICAVISVYYSQVCQ